MKKLLLYLFALICCAGATAQPLNTQLEQAKFDIIKKTIEFLSTDNTTFKTVKSHTCGNCKNIDDLRKFSKDNNLINAESMVIDPLEKRAIDSSADKWHSSLLEFKQRAINRVISAKKKWRETLPGHDAYLAGLNSIVEGVHLDQAQPVQAGKQQAIQDKKPQARPASAGVTGTDTAVQPAATPFVAEKEPVTAASASGWQSWLPYAIAALLLGLVIYLVTELSKLKKDRVYFKERAEKIQLNQAEDKQNMFRLIDENKQLRNELEESETDRKFLVERLELADREKGQPAAEPEILVLNVAQTDHTPAARQLQPAVTVKYAKYADLGDGFSTTALSDKPDNETIFELSIAPDNSGEYKITADPEAHRYALSNAPYFLGKTCRYDSFPFENASIRTDAPGTVKLNGGKWTITHPAMISFS